MRPPALLSNAHMTRSFVAAALLVMACGCPGNGVGQRPYAAPTDKTVTEKLGAARTAMTSFRGDSTMDYWLNGQRAKGEVLVMGKLGKMVRFAALSPAGGATLAEMACDGTNFVYMDMQNNCVLTGPCDARSIATFFNIELEPDDFLHLALGTPPTLAGATGTVTWDGSKGYERVELKSAEGSQKLTIDARENRWDVLDSELKGADGKVRWSVANTNFEKVEGSGDRRVPKKSQFKSPTNSQDLLVQWDSLEVNVQLQPAQFQMQVPEGLPTCGQKPPSNP